MPVAALINGKIFCIHGGLSPDLENFEQIKNLERPYDDPEKGLLCDLIWSDPLEERDGWELSSRGISFKFGADIVSNFREKNNLSLIVRSHQVNFHFRILIILIKYIDNGYQFFAENQLVTIFSASNYAECLDNFGKIIK